MKQAGMDGWVRQQAIEAARVSMWPASDWEPGFRTLATYPDRDVKAVAFRHSVVPPWTTPVTLAACLVECAHPRRRRLLLWLGRLWVSPQVRMLAFRERER